RAALNSQILAPERHKRGLKTGGAVNNYELGPPEAPRVQVGEEAAPGSRAFAAHVPDRKEHLLPVAPHADRRQHRDVGGLAVQPGLDDGAIEDEPNDILLSQVARGPRVPIDLHLAPGA